MSEVANILPTTCERCDGNKHSLCKYAERGLWFCSDDCHMAYHMASVECAGEPEGPDRVSSFLNAMGASMQPPSGTPVFLEITASTMKILQMLTQDFDKIDHHALEAFLNHCKERDGNLAYIMTQDGITLTMLRKEDT